MYGWANGESVLKTSAVHVSADQVLVTVGTVSGVSATGTVETQRALVAGAPHFIGLAAFDAGLVAVDVSGGEPRFSVRAGGNAGEPISVEEIEARWGQQLRGQLGIRQLGSVAAGLPADLGARLPHDLESGGLRRLLGMGFSEMRNSGLRDMATLFQNDPRLGPSIQAQLFLYGGLQALSSLPVPLPALLPQAHRFRVSAGCAFPGNEHFDCLRANASSVGEKADKLAYRLSSSLNTHGPALLNALLSPAYNLTKVRRSPELLDGLLVGGGPLRNVPQAPMVVSGACASSLLALCDIAPHLQACGYGGHAPQLVLWTGADAALVPDGRVVEGFGPAALMSSQKLTELNQGRERAELRRNGDALAPFDIDAAGTVIGHAGSGVLVTTLQFAVEHQLDITSLIVGLGQSGETGGKGHFAGVGFGGENALIFALRMAARAHGYGVEDFDYLVAHATGTRTNSRTDLVTVDRARKAAALEQGASARLRRMAVGAPKALGDGHTMGEAGLRSAAEGIQYVLGAPAVGVPSLRRLDPELSDCVENFDIRATSFAGNEDGGAIAYAQGFGGYDAAVALRAAHPDALRRYRFEDEKALDAYLERRAEIRRQRIADERRARFADQGVLALAERHRYPGLG